MKKGHHKPLIHRMNKNLTTELAHLGPTVALGERALGHQVPVSHINLPNGDRGVNIKSISRLSFTHVLLLNPFNSTTRILDTVTGFLID